MDRRKGRNEGKSPIEVSEGEGERPAVANNDALSGAERAAGGDHGQSASAAKDAGCGRLEALALVEALRANPNVAGVRVIWTEDLLDMAKMSAGSLWQ